MKFTITIDGASSQRRPLGKKTGKESRPKYESLDVKAAGAIDLPPGDEGVNGVSGVNGVNGIEQRQLSADDGLRASTTIGCRSAQTLGKPIKEGRLKDPFTARNIKQKSWGHPLKTDDHRGLVPRPQIAAALEWLEQSGWIKSEKVTPGEEGGRPKTQYRINPRFWLVLAVHKTGIKGEKKEKKDEKWLIS